MQCEYRGMGPCRRDDSGDVRKLLRRLQRGRLFRRDPERGGALEQEIGASASAIRQIASAPATPAMVTISEIVPMSGSARS
jgi:hypothetical protein